MKPSRTASTARSGETAASTFSAVRNGITVEAYPRTRPGYRFRFVLYRCRRQANELTFRRCAARWRRSGPRDRKADRAVSVLPALALRSVLIVVALKSALNLAFAGRYGWQRDELYYAVAGHHLQGGYVEYPPVTALFSALARVLFGYSLVGFRLFTILAGAGTVVVAALIARELGGGRRAQVLAAVVTGFAPTLIATNGLFQPVSFDQLATMVVLWLALRLALGRGSWLWLGLAAGIGLETKYTLAVVLVLLLAAFLVWRRDLVLSLGLLLALGLAALLLVPNLIWEAQHGWASVHWFLHPEASATDESRPQYVIDVLTAANPIAVPVAVAGVLALVRERALRPLGWVVVGTVLAYLALGGKSYYAFPVVLFALAAGAVPFERWATRRRLQLVGAAFVVPLLYALPLALPVLPLHTADRLGVIAARSDYQDEVGWHALARNVESHATGADVIIAANYGEAGALELFGRGLPPVASGHVSFRYWRPAVSGRSAVLVGWTAADASSFCHGYRQVGKIAMPVKNEERGRPYRPLHARRQPRGGLAADPRHLRGLAAPLPELIDYRPMAASPSIVVDKLVIRRGGVVVLDELSLEVAAGRVTGLLGPSGSGKTTLMRAIVGVQIVESGTIVVLGEPAGTPSLRWKVGYMTQNPAVLRRPDRAREPALLRPHPRRRAGERGRGDRDRGYDALRRARRQQAFGRAAGARLAGDGAGRESRAARSRRAHRRPRPGAAARPLEDLQRARRQGEDASRLEPRDGRGRSLPRPAAAARRASWWPPAPRRACASRAASATSTRPSSR